MTNARPPKGTGAVELPGGQNHDSAPHGHNLAEHAVAYARAGLPVLPLHIPTVGGCSCADPGCRSIEKHPRTPRGKDDATTDLRRVAALWACWPDANVGLRPPEGMVVLDVDPRAGGASALVDLLAERARRLVPTLTATTGGGGLHAWYACAGPYRGQLCPGVDLKASTSYVVAPPSVHASGRRYEWASALEISIAPAWLRQLIRRPITPSPARPVPASSIAADGLVCTVATTAEGGRNRALHWAACRAAERGAPDELLDRLRDAARSVGLDDREIEDTICSALRNREAVA